jgi:hypothetical protein
MFTTNSSLKEYLEITGEDLKDVLSPKFRLIFAEFDFRDLPWGIVFIGKRIPMPDEVSLIIDNLNDESLSKKKRG